MFEKLHRWLKGDFTCKKCGAHYRLMSFGYGEIICPNCYEGEKQFIFLDIRYWLNRIIYLLMHQVAYKQEKTDPVLINLVSKQPELEVLES